MSRLPVPVRRALRSDADDVALERVWQGVLRRRGARARSGSRLRWMGLVAAAAVVLLGVLAWRAATHLPTADRSGPLRLGDDGEVATLSAPPAATRAVDLSDGSRIELDPGARLETLENGPTVFSVLLAQGRATFDVRPGGLRRWSVECGLVTVEVVGTRFTVVRELASTRVSVERGVVLVRGERVRDRVRRLVAGDSVEVTDTAADAPAAPAPAPSATAAESLAAPGPHATTSPVPPGAVAPSSPALAASSGPDHPAAPEWRTFAQRGDNAEAYATLGPAGIATATQVASVDDLLALADVARLSGHPADAVAPLTRVVSEHANDPRTPLAAFTLGRLQLDVLGHPALAAKAFEQAIALGLPQSLQEDAQVRLVQARARAGDRAGARAAEQDYERRFPAGKRLDELRRLTRSE